MKKLENELSDLEEALEEKTAEAEALEAELREGLAEGLEVVESAYANATAALTALGQIQDAIDNEEYLLAEERFAAFMRTWNGEPADLQSEVDRIEKLIVRD